MSVYDGKYIPSDNNIAVGPNHIVEVVNAAYAVYSKSGTKLLGPVPISNLWTGLASTCGTDGGDVIVQYDRLANRWVLTQLGALSNPYSECVAVSQTGDPTTTSYYLYSYSFGSTLPDYPKWGVWPTVTNSAYLATYNFFANAATFSGPAICAYDRSAMLSGQSGAAQLCWSGSGLSGASYLPVDLDGPTPPLDGTPAYFMSLYGSNFGVYTLAPNFSTNSASLSSFSTIPVAGYTQASSSPQPGTSRTLDALSDRLMYRLALRVFPDRESIVVNHSVARSSGGSGVRWYELQAPVSTTGQFSLIQQGTHAPDGNYRWMGSAAMDQAGNIALGYSVSNGTSVYPSLYYTGRVPGDASGTMQAENALKIGSGSQTGYSRWGDYSSLRIDPFDDCTFWYVNEYLPASSSYGWYTYIGSFKFDSCGSSADFSISATPTSQLVTGPSPAQYGVTVASQNGYTGTVALSASSCPANTTCTSSPTSVQLTPGSTVSSTMTVATTTTTYPGTYNVGISGTAGTLAHSTAVSVSVNQAFTLGVLPPSATVSRGSTASVTVTASSTVSGFPVSLSISGLPKGVSASFSPTSVTTGSSGSKLKISANRSAAKGSSTLTITGTAYGYTTRSTMTLIVQ